MDALLHDLRYALRSLRKSPSFACAAIATIALGVGATTALFSTVNAALLRPLPFPDPDDLYTLRTAISTGRTTSGLTAPLELTLLNPSNGPFVRATGDWIQADTILDDTTKPLQINIAAVTDHFFETFNAPMTLGRSFRSDEAPHSGHPGFAIVLSDHLWRTAFNSDPQVIGKSVRFSTGSMPVVGVASPAFETVSSADVWYPLGLDARNVSHIFRGYLRVRPGTTPEALRAALSAVVPQLARENPVFENDRVYLPQRLADAVLGDLKPTLMIAFGATALLLVIASVNVTNLLLARGSIRTRELAIRSALGAGRVALIRQLVTESMVLALVGGGIGLLLARLGVRVLLLIGKLPRLDQVAFDAHVLTFAFALTAGTGIIIGLLPALRLLTTEAGWLMNEGGRTNTAGRQTHRTLAVMIVAEMALAVALVAGACWLVRNFQNLERVRPGFLTEHRLAVELLLPIGRYREPHKAMAWTNSLLDRLRQLEGVTAVGAASSLPLRPERDLMTNITVAGEPAPYYPPAARWRQVTPGWFEAMGVHLEAGRFFTGDDRSDSGRVAIVNTSFVDRYLRGKDQLRQRLELSNFGTQQDPKPIVPIVGVVDDIRYVSLREQPEPSVYVVQQAIRRPAIIVSTTLADPSRVIPLIRQEVERLDPQIPTDFQLLPTVVSTSLSRQRLGMLLMLLFGIAALTLASVGVFGVIAYAVSQRVREMATRLALGARPEHVFWLMLQRGLALAIAGIVIGVGLAYGTGRVMATSLYEVSATDPLVLITATGLVFVFALVASYIPARRAARVNPMIALRAE